VIAHANQKAMEDGVTVEGCLNLAGLAVRTFDIPFLMMSYYNIPFKYGLKRFVSALSDCGLQRAIIPDIPPEEGREYLAAMQRRDLAPILIYSPATSVERMRYIAAFAAGFIYCVARKGVTGEKTNFSDDLEAYLKKCREGTDLPLALGFGIKKRSDIDFLKSKADIAVIGSQTIRVMEEDGIEAVGNFIRGLR
jgi:tryptophan synthase alpha chain